MTGETRVVTVKVPNEVYEEFALRVPEGDRSNFIRAAINERLQKTPKADKLLELERRLDTIEKEFYGIKKNLAELELLSYDRGKTNPHTFGLDEVDKKMIDYLIHYKGGTTPELAQYLNTNRWMILNRLRRIQRASEKQIGRPVINYYAGEKAGKKKAWWIDEGLIDTEPNRPAQTEPF